MRVHPGPPVLLLAVALAACSASPPPNREEAQTPAPSTEPRAPLDPELLDGDYLATEVATVGWDAVSNAPIVLLRELGSGQVVPIWVGLAEATSIASALSDVTYPRPMTHDLMRDLLADLHAHLDEVVIYDLRDGTYYGFLKLRVAGSDRPLLVDSRPSDGMALALRTGARISIARKILDEAPDFEFLAPEGSEQVVRAFGMTLATATDELRQRFGLPDRPGLVVTHSTGEAASQGLERGDFVVEVNGATPTSPVDFLEALRATPEGEEVRLTYWRDGEEHTIGLRPELIEEPGTGPRRVA